MFRIPFQNLSFLWKPQTIFRLKSQNQIRKYTKSQNVLILGIETSCDDTGCAVINSNGQILGESLHSQHIQHLNNGGIIPPLAQDFHRRHIENVAQQALKNANINIDDIDAIATTVKPGLPLSLTVGMKYGKYLCTKHKKPFIPIHHMEAHALVSRMYENIPFPFLVLLISGGHCLLAIAQDINKYLLLGESLDDAPGEAFDKISRRMKLKNIPEYTQLQGGRALELAASKATNLNQYIFTTPLGRQRDCMFSFAGLKAQALRHIEREEQKHQIAPNGTIPDINNLCGAFQLSITRHLSQRVQRAIIFSQQERLIPEFNQTLVVSGGVACNNFIANGIKSICDQMEYKFIRPPPNLCTDNGIMIAWNGVEKWQRNIDVLENFDDIQIEKRSPLGEDISEIVRQKDIKCNWIKINSETIQNTQKQAAI